MTGKVALLGAVAATLITACTNSPAPTAAPPPAAAPGAAPVFELDTSWPKVPAQWRLGSVSSASADARDHVWIIHRPRTLPQELQSMAAPPVLEFDPDGNFVQGWGGPGDGYEWVSIEHALHVDHRGDVWISGANSRQTTVDNQILKFTGDGKFLMRIGENGKSQGSNDTQNLHQPTGLFVHAPTNELFVADGYVNRRVIVFDADTGAYKRHWGAYGRPPVDGKPATAAPINPSDPWRPYAEALQQFDTVHDVVVSSDGLVYVADRGNKRVQVFTLDGTYVKQQFVGVDSVERLQARSVALSPEPDQTYLFVAGSPQIWILNRRTLETVGSVEGAQGHHIRTDRRGNLYALAAGNPIGDSQGIQKFTLK